MTGTRTGFEVPELRRLRYFHGQLLGARDLQREQDYFREKLKLRMRCLLGYGVVCGLLVEPAGSGGHAAAEGAAQNRTGTRHRRAKVRVTPGLGVDACGNEIVVRHGCEVDLWEALAPDERGSAGDAHTVWVGVEYAELPVEPTRTIFTSGCSDTSDCECGWTQEGFTIRVTTHQPEPDRRCDTCCDPSGPDCANCAPPVLWLARIDNLDWYQPVRAEQIALNIRHPFGRRVPTVITGISWIHGHTYTVDEAAALLGTHDETGGLRVRFSGDIHVEGLRRGVVDIQVIEGGAGRNADSWFMGGDFVDKPSSGYTQELRYRQTTRETLQEDDRVLITVRTAFLLDRCCRPVDGTHVGGRVPLIDDGHSEPPDGPCALPPSGIGPWTSGNGVGGDVFESWFFVREG
jgi:hypothetical protein